MKNFKRLTRLQKECVSGHGLIATEWLFVKDINDSYFQIVNKRTGKLKNIDKYVRERRYAT